MLVILPLSRVFTQTEILNATLICGVVTAITSSQPHFSQWSMLVTSTLRCTIFSTCWLWTLHICFSAGRLTCKFLFSWSLRRDLKKYPGKRQPRCAHSPGDVTELFVTLRASRKIPPPPMLSERFAQSSSPIFPTPLQKSANPGKRGVCLYYSGDGGRARVIFPPDLNRFCK